MKLKMMDLHLKRCGDKFTEFLKLVLKHTSGLWLFIASSTVGVKKIFLFKKGEVFFSLFHSINASYIQMFLRITLFYTFSKLLLIFRYIILKYIFTQHAIKSENVYLQA